MKKLLLAGLSVSLFACAPKEAPLTPYQEEKISQIGESASMTLLKSLKGELVNAIKSEGPVNAVEVCSKKALRITKEIEEKTGYSIKRTTFKFRNPVNAPDIHEEQALRYFEEAIKNKKNPPYYIQTVYENGEKVYRYYKPLKVEAVCLTCHGDKNNMDKSLVEKINKLYPHDKAFGYSEGDFRGVVRVSIPESKLR